jgi:hypothetical protein
VEHDDNDGGGDDKRTVAAADSKGRAAPGNGRRTATATEEERAGAAAERSCVLLINCRHPKEVFLRRTIFIIVKYAGCASGKAATVQRFFAPVRGPDCALWTAQSFVLRSP